MSERACPGLPADWLNAWLAAVGAVVLVPGLRLRWTNDPMPNAVLVSPGADEPASALADEWPTVERLADLPISRHHPDHRELPLNPSVSQWADRAAWARSHPDGWCLSSTHTDLSFDTDAKAHVIDRGLLYTGAAAGRTLHERLVALVEKCGPEHVGLSLDGLPIRVKANGLGFDLSRIAGSADTAEKVVDPVVEILAFFGLSLFVTRGDGTRLRQRGWQRRDGVTELEWMTWSPALDAWGIDALLDVGSRRWTNLGVRSAWQTVQWQPGEAKDPTRGFGARRVAGPWDRR